MNRVNFNFIIFLCRLGYKQDDLFNNIVDNRFRYTLPITEKDIFKESICLDYIYLPQNNIFRDNLFSVHVKLWNENKVAIFIIVSDNKTFVFNAKVKPNRSNPLNAKIEDFSYGISTPRFSPEKLEELRKESIDSGFFWEWVRRHKKRTKEVDEDLLLNLLALRNELKNYTKNELIAHLLILRCLFLKFLEDRRFIEQQRLETILKENNPVLLIEEFNKLNSLLNGDFFDPKELSVSDVSEECINALDKFFTLDFRSGQGTLFPYQFDIIPIALISNVYEAFLKTDDKKEKGIYYTPLPIVNFILSHTLEKKIKDKKNIRILDPACGSGIFLVEAFKRIIDSSDKRLSFEEKSKIMKKSIFGIDIDEKAISIAIFSLYLALLENEDPAQIRGKFPEGELIFPLLKGRNLIPANSLFDSTIFDDQKFDCIVGNPPWGSIPESNAEEKERLKEKIIFSEVRDYQRSQAFLLKANDWSDENTIIGMIVNNSIFYNSNSVEFRKELLSQFRLQYYYELSGVNAILFKKRKMEDIELGSNEPAAVLILDKKDSQDNEVMYITPKLNDLSEFLKIITFCQKDIKRVKQEYLVEEDILWRIFVNGGWEDYQLIKQRYIQRDKNIQVMCHSGFQPKKEMRSLGEPIWKELIKPQDFERYYIKNKQLEKFNWHQELRRRPPQTAFTGERVLLKAEPSNNDHLRLRGIFTDKEMVFKHHILCVKINGVKYYRPYLAILNSSFIGYYLYQISSQWGKGKTRNTLRNKDVENLPFPKIDYESQDVKRLIELVEKMEQLKKEHYEDTNLSLTPRDFKQEVKKIEQEIDEIVFDLYNLKPYEKEQIKDFYLVNVDRKGKIVTPEDMKQYIDKFIALFNFILKENKYLKAEYSISKNLGASVCFRAMDTTYMKKRPTQKPHDEILALVKKKQVEECMLLSFLKEEKIKIYEDGRFYIVKSNQFKDWTPTEARKDAKEEIGLILRNLPEE